MLLEVCLLQQKQKRTDLLIMVGKNPLKLATTSKAGSGNAASTLDYLLPQAKYPAVISDYKQRRYSSDALAGTKLSEFCPLHFYLLYS